MTSFVRDAFRAPQEMPADALDAAFAALRFLQHPLRIASEEGMRSTEAPPVSETVARKVEALVAPVTGSILISHPLIHRDFFSRSVVLLLNHGKEGSYGVVLNKPLRKGHPSDMAKYSDSEDESDESDDDFADLVFELDSDGEDDISRRMPNSSRTMQSNPPWLQKLEKMIKNGMLNPASAKPDLTRQLLEWFYKNAEHCGGPVTGVQ
ncbi:hypothetical protein CYMTET_47100, partial [Cymbomonas tetramitiformis]